MLVTFDRTWNGWCLKEWDSIILEGTLLPEGWGEGVEAAGYIISSSFRREKLNNLSSGYSTGQWIIMKYRISESCHSREKCSSEFLLQFKKIKLFVREHSVPNWNYSFSSYTALQPWFLLIYYIFLVFTTLFLAFLIILPSKPSPPLTLLTLSSLLVV